MDRLSGQYCQTRHGTDDQQVSDVSLAGFRDASQAFLPARGVLARHEAEPGRKVSLAFEAVHRWSKATDDQRGLWPDARHRLPSTRCIICPGKKPDFCRFRFDPRCLPRYLFKQIKALLAHQRGQVADRICEDSFNPPEVRDTVGLFVRLVIHGADIQDRDGVPQVLASIPRTYPRLRHIFADGGYSGSKLRGTIEKIGRWTIQIVKRSDNAIGFELIPRRWVVERTFAWLGCCRRMAKD